MTQSHFSDWIHKATRGSGGGEHFIHKLANLARASVLDSAVPAVSQSESGFDELPALGLCCRTSGLVGLLTVCIRAREHAFILVLKPKGQRSLDRIKICKDPGSRSETVVACDLSPAGQRKVSSSPAAPDRGM